MKNTDEETLCLEAVSTSFTQTQLSLQRKTKTSDKTYLNIYTQQKPNTVSHSNIVIQ